MKCFSRRQQSKRHSARRPVRWEQTGNERSEIEKKASNLLCQRQATRLCAISPALAQSTKWLRIDARQETLGTHDRRSVHVQRPTPARAPDGASGLFGCTLVAVLQVCLRCVCLHKRVGNVCVVTLTARRGRQNFKLVQKVLLQKFNTENCSDLATKKKQNAATGGLDLPRLLLGKKDKMFLMKYRRLTIISSSGNRDRQCNSLLNRPEVLLRLRAGWECRQRSCGTLLMCCLLTCRAERNGVFLFLFAA